MHKSEGTPSFVPDFITHSELKASYFSLGFNDLSDKENIDLQDSLYAIDDFVENTLKVENFLEDLEYQGDFHKTIAYYCGIQGVSYEGGKYGFFDERDGKSPDLSYTQIFIVEYVGRKMSEVLLKRAVKILRVSVVDILVKPND